MMNITLLAAQAALADTLAGGNPVLTPVSEEARMNLWDMAMKGGWIMLVLALLSVVCFYIFFERMAVIRKAGKDDPLFMERIRDYIRTGEIKSAINYCRITNTPSARMIALPIPAPAAYQATDATAVLAPPRKSSKKLIAVLCALLATILVAALAFIVPNFTAVKAMLGFQPTNPLVVTFDAINSLSTLRSTKYELRTHSSTDDSLDARMSGMYSLGQNHQ